MWVVRKKKGYVFELAQFPDNFNAIESYTLLILNDNQYKEMLSSALWQQDFNGVYMCKAAPRTKLYRLFNEIAYSKLLPYNKIDTTKKVESCVQGTSRLVRSSDRSKIYIARRKGKSTLNETRFNSVCIDNDTREQFFNDVKNTDRYLDGILIGNQFNTYDIICSDEKYTYWNKFMDEEYFRQVAYADKNS